MAPNLAKRLICSNKNAEEQRQDELSLSLKQMRNRRQQYKESVSAVGKKGVAMADAIEIAKTINSLAETLRDAGLIVDGETYADLNKSLMQASEKLQACTESVQTVRPRKVSFYNQNFLPQSPNRQSPEKTPKRSNCTSVDQITTSESGFSESSGYLATIGDEDDSACGLTPKQSTVLTSSEVQNFNISANEKKGTRLSLNFGDASRKEKSGRKIRIVKNGANDITIWGPAVKGLTLHTKSSNSSGENRGPDDLSGESHRTAKQRVKDDPPSCESIHRDGSYADPIETRKMPLEQIVLGAMKTSITGATESEIAMDSIMNSTSNVSEFLPSDGHDRKKWKSAKADGEKGFEVFLEQTSEQKKYSSNKLKERADFSERLQRKRQEIMDIKQDLELCSMLLDECNDETTLQNLEASRRSLARIEERRPKTPSRGSTTRGRPIIRD